MTRGLVVLTVIGFIIAGVVGLFTVFATVSVDVVSQNLGGASAALVVWLAARFANPWLPLSLMFIAGLLIGHSAARWSYNRAIVVENPIIGLGNRADSLADDLLAHHIVDAKDIARFRILLKELEARGFSFPWVNDNDLDVLQASDYLKTISAYLETNDLEGALAVEAPSRTRVPSTDSWMGR